MTASRRSRQRRDNRQARPRRITPHNTTANPNKVA